MTCNYVANFKDVDAIMRYYKVDHYYDALLSNKRVVGVQLPQSQVVRWFHPHPIRGFAEALTTWGLDYRVVYNIVKKG